MRNPIGGMLALVGTAMALGCGDGPATGLVTGGSGQAVVTVSSGINPTITWTGGNARRISVTRASGGGVFWDVEALNPQVGFPPPLVHGVVPTAGRENSNDVQLVQGTDFRVNVTLVNGGEGTQVFRP